MKTIAAILIALGLSACGQPGYDALTMSGARTYSGAGEPCPAPRWQECDGSKVPSQANGGGE
jgi:hypothetical protein